MIKARFLYSGLPDYWSGNGRRHDDDARCLFAFYGGRTTLKDIVDGWVDDYNNGGDCESLWDDVGDLEVRVAILDMLSSEGLKDYHSGAVAECAADYASINELYVCDACGENIGDEHDSDCPNCTGIVTEGDCADDDDCFDSPMCVVLIEYEAPEEGYTLAQYDEYNVSEDKAGKWQWVHVTTDEALGGLYDSDDEALLNNPNEV